MVDIREEEETASLPSFSVISTVGMSKEQEKFIPKLQSDMGERRSFRSLSSLSVAGGRHLRVVLVRLGDLRDGVWTIEVLHSGYWVPFHHFPLVLQCSSTMSHDLFRVPPLKIWHRLFNEQPMCLLKRKI